MKTERRKNTLEIDGRRRTEELETAEKFISEKELLDTRKIKDTTVEKEQQEQGRRNIYFVKFAREPLETSFEPNMKKQDEYTS